MPEFFWVSTPSSVGLSLAANPLAQLLRIGRARIDISQNEVARLAGVSRFRLHQAERGLIALRVEELDALVRVLQLPELKRVAESSGSKA